MWIRGPLKFLEQTPLNITQVMFPSRQVAIKKAVGRGNFSINIPSGSADKSKFALDDELGMLRYSSEVGRLMLLYIQ
jgi:hypothetical protein